MEELGVGEFFSRSPKLNSGGALLVVVCSRSCRADGVIF